MRAFILKDEEIDLENEDEWKEFCRLFRHYQEVICEKKGFALRYEGHPGITYDRVYNAIKPM